MLLCHVHCVKAGVFFLNSFIFFSTCSALQTEKNATWFRKVEQIAASKVKILSTFFEIFLKWVIPKEPEKERKKYVKKISKGFEQKLASFGLKSKW